MALTSNAHLQPHHSCNSSVDHTVSSSHGNWGVAPSLWLENGWRTDRQAMASTLDFALVREPQLLDLIDDEWAHNCLPDDGELRVVQSTLQRRCCWQVALSCSNMHVASVSRQGRPVGTPFSPARPSPAQPAAHHPTAAAAIALQTSRCLPTPSCCPRWTRSRGSKSPRSGWSWGCWRWASQLEAAGGLLGST